MPRGALFKKPSWARSSDLAAPKQTREDDHDSEDLFRRSETYVDIAAEETRRKAEHRAAKKKKQQQQLRSKREKKEDDERGGEEETDDDDGTTSRMFKRRRTSESQGSEDRGGDVGDDVGTSFGEYSSPRSAPLENSRRKDDEIAGLLHTDMTPRRTRSSESREPFSATVVTRSRSTPIVDLAGEDDKTDDDDDNDNDVRIVSVTSLLDVPPPPTRKTLPADDDDDAEEEEDDEFRELRRKAREKERLRKLDLQQQQTLSPSPANSQSFPPGGDNSSMLNGSPRSSGVVPPPPPDPSLTVYVDSRNIPNTIGVVANTTLTRPLGLMRRKWLDRNRYAAGEQAETIFLVWRGIRLFDITSAKALGISVDDEGNLVEGTGVLNELAGSKLHLEAMNEDIFEDMKRQKARHSAGGAGGVDDQDEDAEGEGEDEPRIMLQLKARGLPDKRMAVNPSTVVADMIYHYRLAQGIGEEREVSFVFDGECLDPNSTAERNDLNDQDNIDVHIR